MRSIGQEVYARTRTKYRIPDNTTGRKELTNLMHQQVQLA